MSLPEARNPLSDPPINKRPGHQCCARASLRQLSVLLTFRQSPNTGRDRWGFHSMSKRSLTVGILTAGLSVGLAAAPISPAAAQGQPVGGKGNIYFLSGAYNPSGQAQKVSVFGD